MSVIDKARREGFFILQALSEEAYKRGESSVDISGGVGKVSIGKNLQNPVKSRFLHHCCVGNRTEVWYNIRE